ncbi:GNAT family N-acetyltransferase [Aliiroseovarius crassostreae]|uniref:GNAT family N-acetyltransferase n=1 Tax=Aliiroseovarius crassostreae TaxID=154981 RepID=UPI0022083F0C|nr:GNAT family N-acetyltransferase [Aliiroseovarius crassostreae]UWQ02854.1 GNAT family N-acetyltransferase [Aliiroseovarius crassostreae]
MLLRKANESDASSIAALSLEVWIGTYLKHGINGVFADYALQEFTVDKIAAMLRDPMEHVIVSENKEGIDGFARISWNKAAPINCASTTEITTLYVQPRHHGRGIGKALLDQVFEVCRARGIEAVWLATNSENTNAIRFYEKLGFLQIGNTHFRINDQAYLNDVFCAQIGARDRT